MVIDAAREHDLPAVRRLLETQAVPLDGVNGHLTMVVAKEGNRLVARRRWNCTQMARYCDLSSSIRVFEAGDSVIG